MSSFFKFQIQTCIYQQVGISITAGDFQFASMDLFISGV